MVRQIDKKDRQVSIVTPEALYITEELEEVEVLPADADGEHPDGEGPDAVQHHPVQQQITSQQVL